MTQEERLNALVEAFCADAGEPRALRVAADSDGKRRLLRSLMNVRMPRALAAGTLALQDEYLQARNRERGVVRPQELPTADAAYGSKNPQAGRLSLWQGDITRLAADAIVNAANSQMLGCFVPMHLCIDNCIHTFAGVQLRLECARQMQALRARYGADYEQPIGVPLLTDGYNLPAKKVIHVAGPIVSGPLTAALRQDLAACYRNSLELCRQNGLRTVAFCCISTGVFRFPNRPAAEIAVGTATDWLAAHPGCVDRVIFNVFRDEDRAIYEDILSHG